MLFSAGYSCNHAVGQTDDTFTCPRNPALVYADLVGAARPGCADPFTLYDEMIRSASISVNCNFRILIEGQRLDHITVNRNLYHHGRFREDEAVSNKEKGRSSEHDEDQYDIPLFFVIFFCFIHINPYTFFTKLFENSFI